MKHITLILLVLAALTPLHAESTSMIESWFAPEAKGMKFNKVLAIAAIRADVTRKQAEDEMARLIKLRGTPVQVSYEILSAAELDDPASARQKIAASGADGVVLMRMYSFGRSTRHQPGSAPGTSTSSRPDPSFQEYSFFSKHGSSDELTYTKLVVEIETLVYSLKDDKLLWRGVSRTKEPLGPHVVVQEITEEVIKKMKQQGIIKE